MTKFFIKYLEKRGYAVFLATKKKSYYLDQKGETYKIFKSKK